MKIFLYNIDHINLQQFDAISDELEGAAQGLYQV